MFFVSLNGATKWFNQVQGPSITPGIEMMPETKPSCKKAPKSAVAKSAYLFQESAPVS